jgi:uncharacterized protein (DUF1501 family)
MTMDEPTATGARTQPCGCPEGQALSRRSFLKIAAAAGALAGLVTEGLATRLAFAAAPYDGDVLVVLSLRGGFDGLQAIVPAGDPHYLDLRPNIAIPSSTLIPLDAMFGLHPAMAPLKPFWDAGLFGAVQAVGMAEPNRSHFSAMEEMERAAPGTSLRTGWIDRMLGLRDAGTPFQATQIGDGRAADAFTGPTPELAMYSVDSFGLDAAWDAEQRVLWETALEGVYRGAPEALAAPARVALQAMSTAATLQDLGYTPANGASYPDTDLGAALKDVARLIKADVGLQVAAVDYGDWDMHAGMGDVDRGWMHDHLTELSRSLAAFATDLGDRLADVTLLTMTEFGRCAPENGSGGTDHGFGHATLLLGGGVRGGQVHGAWPGLAPDNLLHVDLMATTDYRTLLAEALEKRCRAGSASSVFPGIGSDRPNVFTQRA